MKKNIKLVIFIALLSVVSFLIIPLFINISFKINAPTNILVAEWGAADALNYYGSILTYLGTSILSVIALYQNHMLKKSNDQHIANVERLEKIKNSPVLVATNISSLANKSKIEFRVSNISEHLAQDVEVYNFTIISNDNKKLWSSSEKFSKPYLYSRENLIVKLSNDIIKEDNVKLSFSVRFSDKYGNKHTNSMTGFLDKTISNSVFSVIESSTTSFPYDK